MSRKTNDGQFPLTATSKSSTQALMGPRLPCEHAVVLLADAGGVWPVCPVEDYLLVRGAGLHEDGAVVSTVEVTPYPTVLVTNAEPLQTVFITYKEIFCRH